MIRLREGSVVCKYKYGIWLKKRVDTPWALSQNSGLFWRGSRVAKGIRL